VPPHGRLCGFGVVALDGSENPPVAGERFLRAPFQLQLALPRVAQQVHERIDDL